MAKVQTGAWRVVFRWFGNVWKGFKQSLSNFWGWFGSFFAREKLSEGAKARAKGAVKARSHHDSVHVKDLLFSEEAVELKALKHVELAE
ncbi:hypothetical protein, partial [Bartonella sp. CM31XJBT]